MADLPKDMTFSNPRTEAMIEDWPFGSLRCRAKFWVERHPRRGMRVCRQTENKDRGWNKPKATSYAPSSVIVDGSDGRTYILSRSGYRWLHLMNGDMKYSHGMIPEDDPRFEATAALLAIVEQPAETGGAK